jgi:beta-phosphoglucomutase
MARRLAAVIFDLDGVIADTFELYYMANGKVAEALGLPFSRADNEAFRGIGRAEVVAELVRRSGKPIRAEQQAALAEMKNRHYQDLIQQLTPGDALPGIAEFLGELRVAGIRTGLASSSTNARTVLDRLGLLQAFDVLTDPGSVVRGKPDPAIFLRTAELLGVPCRNCAALEDGEAGLRAIQATPMFAVGVGGHPYMRTADWHVRTTAELHLNALQQHFYKGGSQ